MKAFIVLIILGVAGYFGYTYFFVAEGDLLKLPRLLAHRRQPQIPQEIPQAQPRVLPPNWPKPAAPVQ